MDSTKPASARRRPRASCAVAVLLAGALCATPAPAATLGHGPRTDLAPAAPAPVSVYSALLAAAGWDPDAERWEELPPGLLVRGQPPAVIVPRGIVPQVRQVPLPATGPVYLAALALGIGLFCTAGRPRRRMPPGAPRRRRRPVAGIRRYARPAARFAYWFSRASRASSV